MNGIPLATVVGLLLALGGPLAFALLKSRNKQGPIDMAGQLGAMWGLCLALLAIVLFWELRPLSSLGIVWGNYGAWAAGTLIGVTMIIITILSIHLSLQRGQAAIPESSAAGVKRLTDLPLWGRYAIVITAGITEEILFRGYPIERLQQITGSVWLAALIPLVVFVLAHLGGWTIGHLAGVLFGGVLLTGLYLITRDLVACMIAHVLIDTTIIFLPALLRRYGNPPSAIRVSGPAGSDVPN
ncbi:CPBP family intramembrane glutamic endopeptidase [Duganella zoogloeoides]|uniref:CPBP family intramembrane glutamic endopeptidase n=1 Tax=Duganella zoogloeoides TaxID=75659 RepID=A0ABZ0XXU4_9BURK|nr:CPBP family intramembrane glutamic endopeptidase [Duganella zoogloeoides]WQH04464.1 CPBP family intramembrane glutamic endopeptidase [Duganella zoogloeoides]